MQSKLLTHWWVSRSAFLGFLFFVLSSWLQTTPTQAQSSSRVCPAQLNEKISALIDDRAYQHARWGIMVQALDPANRSQPQPLFARNAEQYFTPASTAKLLTTAAALHHLGPQFRARTYVDQAASASGAVILRVRGGGDPSLTDEDLTQLAEAIRARGITQIDRLLLDDQFFRGDTVNSTWELEDIQAGYGAPANSLMLNQNQVGLTIFPQALGQPLRVEWDNSSEARGWRVVNQSRTVATTAPEFLEVGRDLSRPILHLQGHLRAGSAPEPMAIAITQPTQHFGEHFRRALNQAQIQVKQLVNAPSDSELNSGSNNWEEIATVASPPLPELLIETNQQSNNLFAEALLRHLGTSPPAPKDSTSLEAGLETLELSLTHLGVDANHYSLSDGSGLSRRNLISPIALIQTLQTMARSADAATYRASLSVSGINGSLQNRFQGTPVQGKLQGKTGTMSGVVSLAGYLDPPDYSPIVLSIVINSFTQSIGSVQQTMDEIVETLALLHPC
jgi:D-alanyl-D-alanine carboxypeptidase/D-alanyl-D-alanine-endopeptidase (penicillin-binding protein 4)